MSPEAQGILDHLRRVQEERNLRAADPELGRRVRAVKAYQHRRFECSYADLLADPGSGDAARFFLSDLYGTQDFRARDAQFGRVVPSVDRLFSRDIVRTLLDLGELHALSETLDRRLAQALIDPVITPEAYLTAWCTVGEPALRERQIQLMAGVGRALVGYTRNRWLRHTLRLMRGPALAAGLESLHGFLERGYDIFAALRQPQVFLDTLAARERALAAQLFCHPTQPPAVLPPALSS